MAIRKMKFVSIVGKLEHFDEFVYNHIIDSNLHPENALNIITLIRGLVPFSTEETKSDQLLKDCISLLYHMNIHYTQTDLEKFASNEFIQVDDMEQQLSGFDAAYRAMMEERDDTAEKIKEFRSIKESIGYIKDIDFNVEEFFNLEFVKFRFGKVPKAVMKQLEIRTKDLDVIMIPLITDDKNHWFIYFTPSACRETVDGVFSSMQFERTRLSSYISGTPQDAMESITISIDVFQKKIDKLEQEIATYKQEHYDKLLQIYCTLIRINRIHEVRRNAFHTNRSFYICGWIPEDDLETMAKAIENSDSGTFVQEEPSIIKNIKPPTELKNHRFFRFFEVFVKMYGLPAYNEIDPTPFVAITYFLMFGIMFGDVGQGLIIALVGLLLSFRKFTLSGVFICVGISSTIFGFIYGSVFGNEEIIRGIVHPMTDKTTLLIAGIVVGVCFMTVAMILNVINGLKEKNLARVLFDRNGVAGFVFYWVILGTALYYLINGALVFPLIVIIMMIGIPFLAIFFKEPLERLIEKKSFLPKQKGMFFVQGFFEMIDMLLSLASNTISFIRIGAFALNHAGLFLAFQILSKMAGNIGSIFVQIFANLLIIGLEGLIVGIQCLRLEYYEMFSRFFKGGGKTYKPLRRNML